MIAMGLGIVAGVLFGDYCGFLQIFGDAFIKLLQMTILPYITVSMILGIGGLTLEQAKLLAKKAGILMLLFWGLSFVMVLLLPFSFPQWQSAAGTMTIEEFGRLQVYLVSFNVGAVFMTFWVLPMLLAPATPFKYRDIMGLDAEPKHPRWSIVRNVLGWEE